MKVRSTSARRRAVAVFIVSALHVGMRCEVTTPDVMIYGVTPAEATPGDIVHIMGKGLDKEGISIGLRDPAKPAQVFPRPIVIASQTTRHRLVFTVPPMVVPRTRFEVVLQLDGSKA